MGNLTRTLNLHLLSGFFVALIQPGKTVFVPRSFFPWQRTAAIESASRRQPGGLHLPLLMLQGRGFTGSKGVPTSPVPQVSPPGVTIRMGRPQATTPNMRGVGTNYDPGCSTSNFVFCFAAGIPKTKPTSKTIST